MALDIKTGVQRASSDSQGDTANPWGSATGRCSLVGVPSWLAWEAVPRRGAYLPSPSWPSRAQLCESDFPGDLGQCKNASAGASRLNQGPKVVACARAERN